MAFSMFFSKIANLSFKIINWIVYLLIAIGVVLVLSSIFSNLS